MIIVINAGGAGTRLWPLSTPDYPKHLLTLFGDESLLQNAYRRARKVTKDVYVVTEQSHAHLVKEQLSELGDDNVIIEPGRRGTSGCIIAGLHHIQSRHDHDEPIAFIHADHVIRDEDGFAYSFEVAGKSSAEHQRLTLIGIEPTYPSVNLGYIQKAEAVHNGGLIYKVAGFVEKPEFDVAKKYLKSGHYLWNCGYFVASVNVFARDLAKYSPEWKKNYDALVAAQDEKSYTDTYLAFEKDAIDYTLMEPHDNLQVVPASFDWMDVGSYKDIHDAVDSDQAGNHVNGTAWLEEVENSFVRNETDTPMAVIGLDNVVVVHTPKGLLIARKDLSQKVKTFVESELDKK